MFPLTSQPGMGTSVGSAQDEVGVAQQDVLITGGRWHQMPHDLWPGLAFFRELGLHPCSQGCPETQEPWQCFPRISQGLWVGWGQL